MRQEKRKKKGGEKAKSKSQDCCVTFKPKNFALLSAHALTSQADASGSEGREVYDLLTGLWQVLALYSTTVTRKPLD